MQPVTTPTKGDDGIGRLKQSLSARWGLRFIPRDTLCSPSKRDLTSLDDKIHACIQFLFWRKGTEAGALDYALSQFERHATSIASEWIFKPKGEANVTPALPPPLSGVNAAFLKKRSALSDADNRELKQCLHAKLSECADRIKRGQSYIAPALMMQSIELDPPQGRKPSNGRHSGMGQRQTNITQWARSKSAPNQSTSSIDEYPDQETDNVMKILALNEPSPDQNVKERTVLPDENDSLSNHESFETPPSSPLTDFPYDKTMTGFENSKIAMPPPDSKKRSYSELSRAVGSMQNPKEVNKRRASNNSTHSFSHLSHSQSTIKSETSGFSSATSPSTLASAITSPNTSFSTTYSNDSKTPSFDLSSAEDSDVTVQAPMQLASNADAVSSITMQEQGKGIADVPSALPTEDAIRDSVNKRLNERSPFMDLMPTCNVSLGFRQLFEMARVSKASNVPLASYGQDLWQERIEYRKLWALLAKATKSHGASMPEPSTLTAWQQAGAQSDTVAFSGRLRYRKEPNGPLLDAFLRPLRIEPSYRLSREFGSDRFCVMSFPGFMTPSLPRTHSQALLASRDLIIHWLARTEHKFLNRIWRAFYLKEDSAADKGKASAIASSDRFKIYLFAVSGSETEFQTIGAKGELDPRCPHKPMPVENLLTWFMHAETNQNQTALKLFSRLQLGVSKTTPTIDFVPWQIYRTLDSRADMPGPRKITNSRSEQIKTSRRSIINSTAPSMNDGCARLSQAAGRNIKDFLGLDYMPSAFQGRFGGAKGMWLVDADSSGYCHQPSEKWIEVTESQVKFEDNPSDIYTRAKAKLIFEVNDYVKSLRPSGLSIPLMLILENRKVPVDVFEKMLWTDITTKVGKLLASMQYPLDILQWSQQNRASAGDANLTDTITMLGGLPSSPQEVIKYLIESGFKPTECRYLKDLIYDEIKKECWRIEQRVRIEVPKSTYVYMYADYTAELEEDEIHLGFSRPFHDPESGSTDHELHNCDVLVARSPAYLPSDIQRVRAVFKPSLRSHRDIIFFSAKGNVPLASKLSGGDYDGDKAWVCWDQRLVKHFENTAVPSPTPIEAFGMEKDTKKVKDFLDDKKQFTSDFIQHGFQFNLQASMLGKCSVYLQNLCYRNRNIETPESIEIANLLGLLVDSAKGGFMFDDAKWLAYLQLKGLPLNLQRPAYKTLIPRESNGHFIDRLMFNTGKAAREYSLKGFDEKFRNVPTKDDDLFAIHERETKAAHAEQGLSQVLDHLNAEIGLVVDQYMKSISSRDSDNRYHKESSTDHNEGFRATVSACRHAFCEISPIPPQSSVVFSERIQEWQRRHEEGHKPGSSPYWDLLKASAFFRKHQYTNIVWQIAGVELAEIKAAAGGPGTYRIIRSDIHTAFKVNNKVVEARKGRTALEDLMEEVEDGNQDCVTGQNDDDEYGEWPSDDDF